MSSASPGPIDTLGEINDNEDPELSAVLQYLEEQSTSSDLFRPTYSLGQSLLQIFQSPDQRIWNERDSAVREFPEWSRYAVELSQLASKETLNLLKAKLESECEQRLEADQHFMGFCVTAAVTGSIIIIATELYPAILTPKGQLPFDLTFLTVAQAMILVSLIALIGYAFLRTLITQRILFTLRRWALLLGLAS